MAWRFTPAGAPLLVGSVLLLGLAALAFRRRPARGTTSLVALCLALFVYVASYAGELGSGSLRDVAAWLALEYLGVANVPVLVLVAVVAYAGSARLVVPVAIAPLFAIPAVTCLLAFTNASHELIWQDLRIDASGAFTRTLFVRGPWYWVQNAYAHVLIVAAVAVLVARLVRVPRGLFRRQLAVMLAGVAFPTVVHLLYLSRPLVSGLDPNPYAALVTAVLLSWGMLDARLWDVVPVARELVVGSMRDAVVAVDGGGRVADLNPAAQQLLGVTVEEAIGRPLGSLGPGGADLARALAAGRDRLEIVLELRGQTRDFDLGVSGLEGSAVTGGKLLMLHDTSERRAAESLRETLVRTTIHDLRNPLTVIVGALDAALAEGRNLSSAEERELLELARENSESLVTLVNSILEVERLQRGGVPLEKEPLHVNELLEKAARLQEPLAQARGRQVEIEALEALPAVDGDRGLVARVLQNLLDNALKFSSQGGRVRVHARQTGAEVVVSVSDDGPGIPASLRGRLFREFVSGGGAEGGSGLGLAFCRMAVEAHGGRIWLETPERGTTISFSLPVVPGGVASFAAPDREAEG